jgi:hypothetical protein
VTELSGVLETLDIQVRIDAPAPRETQAHSKEAGEALIAAVEAAEAAVKALDNGVTFVGVGYGIPRKRAWRASR